MCDLELAIKPTYTVDFNICPRLIKLYADSTHDMFVGERDGPYDMEVAEAMLHKYATARKYGSFERDGFLKIMYDGQLVGFSIPRAIVKKEHKAMKLDMDTDYHRLGTVYIDPEYRGMGIMCQVIKAFIEERRNVVWACNTLNSASRNVALSAGLKFSHYLYLKDKDNWSFEPFEDQVRVTEIYSIKTEVI